MTRDGDDWVVFEGPKDPEMGQKVSFAIVLKSVL